MSNAEAFWNRIAKKYAAQPVADPAAYEEKLARTRTLLRPDMDLLEFGCGTGTTALIHAPLVRSVLAIDSSREMIAIARAKAEDAGIANARFEISSIEALEVDDESFDIILGMSILHLVADRDAVIARVRRLLKPGGIFVSSTACIDTMPTLIRWILPLIGRLGLIPHVHVFSDKQLAHSLETAGFAITDQWRPDPKAAVFMIARKG
jgi:ubiquinone/menaquinone biosynthesis C-methylase UbiE